MSGIQKFIEKIAAYETLDEVLATATDDDQERNLYEEYNHSLYDVLAVLILEARALRSQCEQEVWVEPIFLGDKTYGPFTDEVEASDAMDDHGLDDGNHKIVWRNRPQHDEDGNQINTEWEEN